MNQTNPLIIFQIPIQSQTKPSETPPNCDSNMNLALLLTTLSLTLTTSTTLAGTTTNNANNPVILEPANERANRLVGPEVKADQCLSDSDCLFLDVCWPWQPPIFE